MKNESSQSGLQDFKILAGLRFWFGPGAIAVGLLFVCALTVVAQSGRRAPKSVPVPAPPESTPSPTKPAEKEKPARSLIVGIDSNDSFGRIPLYFNDSVLESCVQRMHEGTSVKVDVQRNMHRGEALKRAKAEQETEVVLLQLRTDSMGSSGVNADLSQVYIEYFVFAPTTAKLITSGHAYQQALRTKGVIAPPTSGQSSIAFTELRLKQAARDAAERILGALHISRPSELPRGQHQFR